MFYSQFILAKKGPLGTIWIAAHLERKLRKNQVADTDIGVSVDSILFPEVPIALRLSSHLLLGVVRIYSRKVNYLFHDCSEALLKIKQAFRSTAVDLPPEESTAPYHSITLPETFDLDDFELPDNALFQGNFVDHHISTREQITLQDTMDGMVYPTSQFGLDERFGDGDTSQIGLDLDEDLFLEKVSSGRVLAPFGLHENADPQTSAQRATITEMDIDGVGTSNYQPNLLAGDSRELIDSDSLDMKGAYDSAQPFHDNIQTPDLNEEIFHFEPIEGPNADAGVRDLSCNAAEVVSSNLNESAQAPSTPGLISEAAPSLNLLKKNAQNNAAEVVVGKPNLGPLVSDYAEPVLAENLGIQQNESDNHIGGTGHGIDYTVNDQTFVHSTEGHARCDMLETVRTKCLGDTPSPSVLSADMLHSVASPTSVLGELKTACQAPENSSNTIAEQDGISLDRQERVERLDNGAPSNDESSIFLTEQSQQTHGNVVGLVSMENQKVPSDFAKVSYACSIEAAGVQASDNDIPLGDAEHVVVSNDRSSKGQGTSESAAADEVVDHIQQSNNSDPEALIKGQTDVANASFPPTSALPSDDGVRLESTEKQENEPSTVFPVLQSCSLSANKADSLPDGGVSAENAADLSPMDAGFHSMETHDVASSDLQDRNAELQQTQVTLRNELLDELNKSDECSDGVNAKHNQLGDIACSTSSELPAPETLLSAPTEVSNIPNGSIMQSTEGEPIMEEEVTVDRLNSLSGKKRRLTESTPVLENGNSSKFSRALRSKRSMDHIPDDDDVLASILVGKKTPVLKMKPTPTPAEVVSVKRPRMTPRVSIQKRKALLDDTMVLHGDVIRKQLTNTEDIRRIRKKAPCTRKEIWMIQKCLLEEEVFNESLFSGISTTLTGLQNQTYYLIESGVGDANESHVEAAGELESSERQEQTKEAGMEVVDASVSIVTDKSSSLAMEPTETVVPAENPENAIFSVGSENKEQTEAEMLLDLLDKGPNDVAIDVAIGGMDMPTQSDPLSKDDCSLSVDARIESLDKLDGTQTTQKDESGFPLDQKSLVDPADGQREIDGERACFTDNSQKDAYNADTTYRTIYADDGIYIETDETVLDDSKLSNSADVMPPNLPHECHDGLKEDTNDEMVVPLPYGSMVETGIDVLSDPLAMNMEPFLPDGVMDSRRTELVVTGENGACGIIAIEMVALAGDGNVANEVTDDDNGRSGFSIGEMEAVVENENVAKVLSSGDNGINAISSVEMVAVVEDGNVTKEEADVEGNLSSSFVRMEESHIASSCPMRLDHDLENLNPTGGLVAGCEEDNHGMDAGIPVMDISTEGFPVEDFGQMLDENETDFLNEDDETEIVEEDGDTVPTAEENRSIDNTGWSSRTRAVARYLKTLFDNETGRGLKSVSVDNLLAGKTRKEASRMFFETLVLKTKDFIHVEQENSFDKINIQPRVKLMKSEF